MTTCEPTCAAPKKGCCLFGGLGKGLGCCKKEETCAPECTPVTCAPTCETPCVTTCEPTCAAPKKGCCLFGNGGGFGCCKKKEESCAPSCCAPVCATPVVCEPATIQYNHVHSAPVAPAAPAAIQEHVAPAELPDAHIEGK